MVEKKIIIDIIIPLKTKKWMDKNNISAQKVWDDYFKDLKKKGVL